MRAKNSLIGLVTLLLGVLMLFTSSAEQLSGDEVLKKVDERQDIVMGGNLITQIRFDNVYSDGTTAYNIFAGLGKRVEGQPDRSLIYFKEPEDVRGTIFLSIKPEGEDARLWLYLPALGMVKELVAEEQERRFAGSTFSYREIGERELSDDYTAELIDEESITIGNQSYPCYVLKLTAKPQAEVEYPTGEMWVAKGSWLVLKSEDYNQAGSLERIMEVLEVGKFEGNLVANKMVAENLLEGSSTTITFLERRRPKEEIPDYIFDPENLPQFDPTEWGLE
jgi:hypothetical protein